MLIRNLLVVASAAALAWACQQNPNDDVNTWDSGTPSSATPHDDTEPVVESDVDESHDDDTDDVLADEGDSP